MKKSVKSVAHTIAGGALPKDDEDFSFVPECSTSSTDVESVLVLRECIELQKKKSRDYQNPDSSVRQADHYRRGVDTIHDMIDQKLKRAQSLIEARAPPSNEALEDTYKDIINYCSFAVSYLRCAMDGQRVDHDMFNRPVNLKDEEADG